MEFCFGINSAKHPSACVNVLLGRINVRVRLCGLFNHSCLVATFLFVDPWLYQVKFFSSSERWLTYHFYVSQVLGLAFFYSLSDQDKRKCECKNNYIGDGLNCSVMQLPLDRCLQDNGQCHPDADCTDLHYQGEDGTPCTSWDRDILVPCVTALKPVARILVSVSLLGPLPMSP